VRDYAATARALLLFSAFFAAAAPGAEPDDGLTAVVVHGNRDPEPSEALIGVGSPQSFVDERAIHEIVSPFGDFGNIANLTPSFVSSAPNGPGFDAAKGLSLRGFVDGQFNVTLDGIPFADPDNFAHHSTSYFPTSTLDHMVIDRSPGGASDLGYASFGGSVNLYSAPIPEKFEARVFAGYGSFNTSLAGATLASPSPQNSGQAGAMLSVEHSQSDGAMSYSSGHKDDFYVKAAALIGSARLTALYDYDRYGFYNPGNITTTDLALYGSSYGYNNDATSPNYYRWSDTFRISDFGYLKLDAALAGDWQFEDKFYTYSYRNTGLSLKGDQTSSPIGNGFPGIDPTDIAGRSTSESYRTYGNDVRIDHRDQYGAFLLGLWWEHSWQDEFRNAVDLTTGLPYNANKVDESPVYFDFTAHLDNLQPYAQYAWQVSDPLKIDFGLRYRKVKRTFDAAVIQNFLPGTQGEVTRTVPSTLPSIDATYKLGRDTNLFAQVSKGSLVPSQSFFYTAHPALGNQANAETSLATQLGIVTLTMNYGIGFDVYNIDFDNYVSTIMQNGDTLYVNSGSVRYRGIETEFHFRLIGGLVAIGNASLLRATFGQSGMTSSIQKAGDTIPYAPSYTGLAGLVYAAGPWGASLIAKFVGTEYQGKNGSADGATYKVDAYSYTNATATRELPGFLGTKNVRLTFAVNNLWNSDALTDNAGPSILGPNLVNVLVRRNYSISVVADM
jgi:iron complex outermembrane receptor protein